MVTLGRRSIHSLKLVSMVLCYRGKTIPDRAGGTAPATPAMAGPKFCEPARKLSARAKINVSRQELTISCQRDHELKALTAFKWSNPIAVSNHYCIIIRL